MEHVADRFQLAFYDPLTGGAITSRDAIDYDPLRTSLNFTTGPGGFTSLAAGYVSEPFEYRGVVRRAGYFERRLDLADFGHVELRAGSRLLAWGRITRPTTRGDTLSGFETQSYFAALGDGTVQSRDQSRRSTLSVLAQSLGFCPVPYQLGDTSAYMDPGVTRTLAQFDGQTVAQVADQVVKQGGAGSVVYDLTVYEGWLPNGTPAPTVQLKPRATPVKADYELPLDETVERTRDLEGCYGSIRFNYTNRDTGVASVVRNADSTLPTDPTFTTRFGFGRGPVVVQGGVLSQAEAEAAAATQLAMAAQPQLSFHVTRDATRGLELPGGGEVPAYLARFGQWVQVGDYPPLLITRTNFDGHSGNFDMELNGPYPGRDSLLWGLRVIARHVENGTVPATGAPR